MVSLDLSLNNLNCGLEHLIAGLRQNDTIVHISLRNNNIDGRRCQKELFMLVNEHPSITSIDLGNSDNIKNRNRIYDEGLQAIVAGMISSTKKFCLISEIHLKSACITGAGLSVLEQLLSVECDLQVLDLSENDLGSEVASHL